MFFIRPLVAFFDDSFKYLVKCLVFVQKDTTTVKKMLYGESSREVAQDIFKVSWWKGLKINVVKFPMGGAGGVLHIE